MLAGMNLVDAIDGLAGLDRPVERAEELANRAIAIDPANPHAVAALAWLALVQRRIDVCHERMEQLLRLCPDHPTFLYRAGFVFAVTGQWERGVGLVEASLRLNPNGPGYLNFFPAMDLCLRGEHQAALQRAYLVDTPGGHLGPLARAVPLARLGRLAEARAELDVLRSAVPAFDEDREAALRKMLMPPPVLAMILDALDAIEPVAG
jgi:tetratricopeptide (TPR) repeat protein